MRTDLRAAAACVALVVLVGCQSAPGASDRVPAPATPTPTTSASPEPEPEPIQTLAGMAPGSDACRAAYAQQMLVGYPTYFDERPVEDPIALLTYDRLSEAITADEHARWGMQRLFQPELVPAEYRLPDLSGEGTDPLTGIALASMWENDCLPLETQQWLTDYMTPTVVPDES